MNQGTHRPVVAGHPGVPRDPRRDHRAARRDRLVLRPTSSSGSGRATRCIPLLGLLVLVLALSGVLVMFNGLTSVQPNEARALVFFGKYVGTVHDQGLQWVNPLTQRHKISVRVRNFETAKLKVNDHDGNPIEIAAVVVWKVVDTAEALFEVDDYEHFVHVQAEAALRNLATSHPYDAHTRSDVSLRSQPGRDRRPSCASRSRTGSTQAGVEVLEARISHLAYAPGDRQRHAPAPAGDAR